MNYLTTVPFESTLVAGLVFQLRKMSHGRRIQLNQLAAGANARLRDEQRILFGIEKEIKVAEEAAKIEPCACAGHEHEVAKDGAFTCTKCSCRSIPKELRQSQIEQQTKIWNQIMVDEFYPLYIRWGVQKIEGFQINGEDVTTDVFIAEAPDELVVEVGRKIYDIVNLTFEEQMGFVSPTTLSAPVDGQIQITNA